MNDGYEDVLEAIASDSPTPGGGSVAALSLAHSYALATMVVRLTLKSDKWAEGHSISEKLLVQCETGMPRAQELAILDAESFDAVIRAFRMPRVSDEEISAREQAIAKGYLEAANVPLNTAQVSLEFMRSMFPFASVCNANAITDLGAACYMAHTAIVIAILNIRINIGFMFEEDSAPYEQIVSLIENEADDLLSLTMNVINNRM